MESHASRRSKRRKRAIRNLQTLHARIANKRKNQTWKITEAAYSDVGEPAIGGSVPDSLSLDREKTPKDRGMLDQNSPGSGPSM